MGDKNNISKADVLVDILNNQGEYFLKTNSVQRSHRFPEVLFIQIENLARIGKVPVSLIINELLDCGLEVVRQKLSKEIVDQLSLKTEECIKSKTKELKLKVKK